MCVLQGVLPEGVLLLITTDPVVLERAGEQAMAALTRVGFFISPKSMLQPVRFLAFLGNWVSCWT